MRVADYSSFLKDRYIMKVLELGKGYLDRKTLIIDFMDLYKFDNEAGKWLLDQPDRELKLLREKLRATFR